MQYYILICGPNGSGKTFLAQQLSKAIPDFECIEGDPFREFLSEQTKYYSSVDYSASKADYLKRSAQRVVRSYLEEVTHELLTSKQSIIRCATSLRPSTRKYRLDIAKEIDNKIVTIIVCLDTDAEVIEERLSERDKREGTNFLKLYQEIGKEAFELPTGDEADHVIIHRGVDTIDNLVQKVKDVIMK